MGWSSNSLPSCTRSELCAGFVFFFTKCLETKNIVEIAATPPNIAIARNIVEVVELL
jgi:hypothetical protein